MSNLKPLDPDDIDESLLKLVESSGKHYVLLPFVDATATAPEYRSLGHATTRDSIRVEDLTQISTQMRERAQGSVWFILFNTPWLLSQAAAEAIRKPAQR
jgi:hypothetical protein